MADEVATYYKVIFQRGWGSWVHSPEDGFSPKIVHGWERRTETLSVDRQVTVAWDPGRFTTEIGDAETLVEIYRNETHKIVLFPAS